MNQPNPGSLDASSAREALARRLHRRAVAEGTLTLPAVPALIDEYVRMCEHIFAGVGVRQTPEQSAQLRSVLEAELAKGYRASPRSNIVISFHTPHGTMLNYRVKAEWWTLEADYDRWVDVRPAPLFGCEPDARVWALSGEVADPKACRVLDIGAGTGRNALALARRGHPVDAVEMAPKFADTIRAEAARESLDVRVIQQDVFAATEDVDAQYQLIVVSEVVPDFRTTSQLRELFDLAARLLAPGGRLVFNTFLARPGYVLDDAARQMGQQCNSMIFSRGEVATAAAGLPLQLVADDPAYDYEKTNLPDGAWPPTGWFEGWARGLDVFDVDPADAPIELRWLVYQKTAQKTG
ncbi:MAG: class I SAM-dependent methyltransferase [Mycobacterium sp.]|nr:class I SAM-dependent methyltransferase [Mycobacterium sp.]